MLVKPETTTRLLGAKVKERKVKNLHNALSLSLSTFPVCGATKLSYLKLKGDNLQVQYLSDFSFAFLLKKPLIPLIVSQGVIF